MWGSIGGLKDENDYSSVVLLYLPARESIAAFAENLIDQPVRCKVEKSMKRPIQECPQKQACLQHLHLHTMLSWQLITCKNK